MRRGLVVVCTVAVAACGLSVRGEMDPSAPDAAPASGDSGEGGPTAADAGDDRRADGDAAPPDRGRVTSGLVALYEFEENGGTVARDTSGVSPALELALSPSGVSWVKGALRFQATGLAASAVAATKIRARCQASNELTIEAWARYGALPDWSRIVANAATNGLGNFAMTSDPSTVGFDLRTSTSLYERSTQTAYPQAVTGRLVHLVETRSASGDKRVYLDGTMLFQAMQGGDFSTWDPTYLLAVGNTPAFDRPWYDDVHLVAIYDRALTAAEVAQNHAVGADP